MSATHLITDYFPKRKRNEFHSFNAKKPKNILSNEKPSNVLSKTLLYQKDEHFNLKPKLLDLKHVDVIRQESHLSDHFNDVLPIIKSENNENKLSLVNQTLKEHFENNPNLPSIAQPDENINFELPIKYINLFESFKIADHIVSIYFNRHETCWFSLLKKGVEQMRKKKFLEKNLGQLLTVYPDSYVLSYQKISLKDKLKGINNYNDIQLVITPLINNSSMTAIKDKFNPQILIKRRAIFFQNLLNIVKGLHKKFLKFNNIHVENEQTIKKWHPKFDLEHVPDIKVAEFPENDLCDTKIYNASNAMDIITRSMSPRTKKAIGLVNRMNDMSPTSPFSLRHSNSRQHLRYPSSLCHSTLTKNTVTPNDAKNYKDSLESTSSVKKSFNFYQSIYGTEIKSSEICPSSPHLKGLSNELINKIRMKEAHKNEMAMFRNNDEENEIKILEKLPDFLRVMKSLSMGLDKNALKITVIEKKWRESNYQNSDNTAISTKALLKTLELISPNLIQKINLRGDAYLKFDRFTDFQNIIVRVDAILKEKMG